MIGAAPRSPHAPAETSTSSRHQKVRKIPLQALQIRPGRRNRCRSPRDIGEISVIHKKRASKWGIGEGLHGRPRPLPLPHRAATPAPAPVEGRPLRAPSLRAGPPGSAPGQVPSSIPSVAPTRWSRSAGDCTHAVCFIAIFIFSLRNLSVLIHPIYSISS